MVTDRWANPISLIVSVVSSLSTIRDANFGLVWIANGLAAVSIEIKIRVISVHEGDCIVYSRESQKAKSSRLFYAGVRKG